MTFMAPGWLWLLLLVAALAVVYVVLQRRRRKVAVRFSNLELLRSVAPRRAGWRRHAVAALVALSLAVLVGGVARPARAERIPKEAATVMLVLDTSASMAAVDVEPSRIDAALTAARSFVGSLPQGIEVGLVAFDRTTRVVNTPTTDHRAVLDGLSSLRIGTGTAAGDGLFAAVDAIKAAAAASGRNPAAPQSAAIVLLSDGVTTVGRPVLLAADAAAKAKIPVSTIAFGTPDGVVPVQGELIPVPADPETMSAVAELTSGKFFEAASLSKLKSVYKDISVRVGYTVEQREVTAMALTGAVVLLTAASALSLLWGVRLP